MSQRLLSDWRQDIEALDLDEEEEILRDKHLVFVTKEFINLLKNTCIDQKIKEVTHNKSTKVVSGSPKEWRVTDKGKELLLSSDGSTLSDLGSLIFETILTLVSMRFFLKKKFKKFQFQKKIYKIASFTIL